MSPDSKSSSKMVAREVLASSTLVHGPDHPSTLLNLGSLATVLEESGELAEAEKTFRDLVDRYQRLDEVFGHDHRRTRTARRRLLELYKAWGRPAAAEPYR